MQDDNLFNSNPLDKQEVINILKNEILGKDYYIASPLGIDQCNEVIAFDIMKQYKRLTIKERLQGYREVKSLGEWINNGYKWKIKKNT